MKRKVKRMNMGGAAGSTQQPTYPFSTNAQPAQTGQDQSGVNQTFNMQPQAQAGQPPRQMTFRKGGYVKKADGCAARGKTRGKIY